MAANKAIPGRRELASLLEAAHVGRAEAAAKGNTIVPLEAGTETNALTETKATTPAISAILSAAVRAGQSVLCAAELMVKL